MKHVRMARILAVLVVFALFVAARPTAAHDDDLGARTGRLDGTWRLVAPRLGDGEEEYKTIGAGRFIWYVVADDRIVRGASGRASFRDGVYTERIDAAMAADFGWAVGGVGRFDVNWRAGEWRHRGVIRSANGETAGVDETWERVD